MASMTAPTRSWYVLRAHLQSAVLCQPSQQPASPAKHMTAIFITMAMVRGVLHHINAAYRQLEINGQPAPPTLSLTKDALLSTTADSTCRQLSAEGKGEVHQQPAFKTAELTRIIQKIRELPPSSFKHAVRVYLFLGINWGGRSSEYYKLRRR